MNKLAIILTVFCAAFSLHAAEVNPAEAKLREGLKSTMLQLRTVQGEKAALETAKAELEQMNVELTAKLEALTKQSTTERMRAPIGMSVPVTLSGYPLPSQFS